MIRQFDKPLHSNPVSVKKQKLSSTDIDTAFGPDEDIPFA
jgi:hypothetical protein